VDLRVANNEALVNLSTGPEARLFQESPSGYLAWVKKSPNIANLANAILLFRISGASVWQIRFSDMQDALLVSFSRLSPAWPRFASALQVQGLAYSVSKDAVGRVVLVLPSVGPLEDTASALRSTLKHEIHSKMSRHRFYFEHGWLALGSSGESNPFRAGAAGRHGDANRNSQNGRFNAKRMAWVAGVLGVAAVTCVVTATIQRQVEGRKLTVSNESHSPQGNAEHALDNKNLASSAGITLSQIESLVRRQLPQETSKSIDADALLDAIVQAQHEVALMRDTSFGGLVQLEFSVSGYEGIVEIVLEQTTDSWTLVSIK